MSGGGRITGWVFTALAAVVLVGCARTDYALHVSALRDPSVGGRTYWLFPGNKGIQPGDLEFRQYAAMVDRAMAARGYVRAAPDTEPHLVVLLSYGTGEPQIHFKTVPWFGVIRAASAGSLRHDLATVDQTMGPHRVVLVRASYGVGPSHGGWGWPARDTTKLVPRRAIISGVMPVMWTEYTSWLRLSAVDGHAYVRRQPVREVWRTMVYTDNESHDLVSLFPFLLAAAMDYVGRATDPVTLRVPQQSPRAIWLRAAGGRGGLVSR